MPIVSSSIPSSPRAESTSELRSRREAESRRPRAAGSEELPAALQVQSVAGFGQLVVDDLDIGFQPRLLDRPVAGVLGRHLPAGGKLVNSLPGLLRVANDCQEL